MSDTHVIADRSSETFKNKVATAMNHIIKNCNRNLYEWVEKKKRGSRFTISHEEVRGLVKNWMIRGLKDIMGTVATDRAVRDGHLYISIEDNGNYIRSLGLSSIEVYRSHHKDIELLKTVLAKIDYKSLRYDPSDYELDGISPSFSVVSHPDFIDLSIIENIKF